MKLEKYEDKIKKRRKALLISIGVIVLIGFSFLLYKTFASFSEEVSFPMMNGKVDYFGNSDIYSVFYQNGELVNVMPKKDNPDNIGFAYAECDNEANIVWNEEEWAPLVKNLKSPKTKCSLYFERIKYYVSANGNDEGNGNKETPLKTIKEAYSRIITTGKIILLSNVEEREGLEFNSNKNITITSEDGTYEIDRGSSLIDKPIIELTNNNNLTLTNIIINGLEIESTKALIEVNNSSITINDGTIIENGNNKTNGGGIRTLNDSRLIINSGEIKNNQAINGGGIAINGKTYFEMNGGEISNNRATLNGGGINIDTKGQDDSIFNFNGGEIKNNKISERGGGIKFNESSGKSIFNLKGTNIIGNTSEGWGGGAYIDNKNLLQFEMSGGIISENVTAKTGGGLTINSRYEGNIFNITGGTITNNQANDGGGLRIFADASNNVFNISNIIISNNTVNGTGGGLHVSANINKNLTNNIVKLISGEITNNTSVNYAGGGIYVENINAFEMSGGSVINNKCLNSSGGGVFVKNNVGSYKKTGGTISSNTPDDVGGIATK